MGRSLLETIPGDVDGLWESLSEHCRSRGLTAPRVVIHGGYGKRNMGDDALFHAIYSRVKKHLPSSRVTAVCHGPDNIKPWYPDIEVHHFKSVGGMSQILKSDVYIIGGGGIVNRINTYSGNMVFKLFDMKGKYQFLAALFAQLFGARSYFYGVGAESFPDEGVRILARLALNHVSGVSVRDPLSLRNLRAIGVRREIVQILDPALSLEPHGPETALPLLSRLGLTGKKERQRPLVGLNLRYVGDPAVDNEKSLDETVRLVRRLVDRDGVDVLFLSISQHPDKHLEDDLDFGRQVRARLRASGGDAGFHLLEEYPHPLTFMALLGQMDAMILSRLHSVILGTKLGVPILTVSYDDKVDQFVKLSGQWDMRIALQDYSLENIQACLERLERDMLLSRGAQA